MRSTIPLLSKSRFTAGVQCLKRLYLECYSPELAQPPDVAQQAVMDSGIAVGVLAREGFPAGRLVEEKYYQHAEAVDTTAAALADPSLPALFEAAFVFDDVRVRVDILRRQSPAAFDLIEVKSSTSVKDEYIPDVAIQAYVLAGSGVTVEKCYLLHINNAYVYRGGPYDLNKLFTAEDVSGDVADFARTRLPSALARMKEVLREDEPPAIDIGRPCSNPYTCEFYRYCRQGTPLHHVEQLPGATQRLLESLYSSGITDIRNVPHEFAGLTRLQQRVRDCVVSGEPFFASGLRAALDAIPRPLYFLDFETFNPALPLYIGTRPYQVIPFQWSLHVLDGEGNLSHYAFLHEGATDPRIPFVTSLLDAIGNKGGIVTYSSYERMVINQLVDVFPGYSRHLVSLNARMADLLWLVKNYCYHPDFHGSFSIKSVLPALVPYLNYDDLMVQEGAHASVAFARLIDPATDESERQALRQALLDYCRRDTEAMVRVFETLQQYAR